MICELLTRKEDCEQVGNYERTNIKYPAVHVYAMLCYIIHVLPFNQEAHSKAMCIPSALTTEIQQEHGNDKVRNYKRLIPITTLYVHCYTSVNINISF